MWAEGTEASERLLRAQRLVVDPIRRHASMVPQFFPHSRTLFKANVRCKSSRCQHCHPSQELVSVRR